MSSLPTPEPPPSIRPFSCSGLLPPERSTIVGIFETLNCCAIPLSSSISINAKIANDFNRILNCLRSGLTTLQAPHHSAVNEITKSLSSIIAASATALNPASSSICIGSILVEFPNLNLTHFARSITSLCKTGETWDISRLVSCSDTRKRCFASTALSVSSCGILTPILLPFIAPCRKKVIVVGLGSISAYGGCGGKRSALRCCFNCCKAGTSLVKSSAMLLFGSFSSTQPLKMVLCLIFLVSLNLGMRTQTCLFLIKILMQDPIRLRFELSFINCTSSIA
mmetsp:Transcript_47102/g.91924  ORF Transcript_47102/g.91924 Transcript_47102/m.91924 type:complete len:281 (-) Transcript_47102:273-1115(-)